MLDKYPFRDELWQSHYPALARFKEWVVPTEPPEGCLNGPLNNVYSHNIIVNFSQPEYWGECEVSTDMSYNYMYTCPPI